MLSIKLASISSINILLIAFLAGNEEPRHALSSEFEVVNEANSYYGKGVLEIYLHDDKFEVTSFIEETSQDGKELVGEVVTTGIFDNYKEDEYNLEVKSKRTSFSGLGKNHKFSDFPISKGLYSAERRLPERNSIDIISSGKDYVIVASYINGGQVLALEKY